MRYPQTFIEDLKRQTDIVRVVQDYVTLKKKGANWLACCPFHKEKTPSFSVSPAKEIFYCFGCHKGGSVFTFVMEIERVAFPDAIRIVAEKTGVPLPRLINDGQFDKRRQKADDVIDLNRLALDWWEKQLESSLPEAQNARDYLSRRGITDDTRKVFRLGYAPDSWEALSQFLREKGVSQEQIVDSGLVVKREGTSGSYDRFRGRLMFPVFDVQGRPIAFGGRTLKTGEMAKYLNSPETAAYVKGRHLYGLNLTRDEIRRQDLAILVEGYLDLIVPYQLGVRHIVASLGTALTQDQAKLLGRFARKVLVNYDGDRAGVQAAKKAIETLLAEDVEVKVLVLEDNADPDEFIRREGAEEYERQRGEAPQDNSRSAYRRRASIQAYRRQSGEALTHIQFVIDQALRDRKLSNPSDKKAAVDEVVPFLRATKGRLEKREYFDLAMGALKVEAESIRRQLWQAVNASGDKRLSQATDVYVDAFAIPPTPAEEELVRLLIQNVELRTVIVPELEPADYEGLATEGVFKALIEMHNDGADIDFDNVSLKLADDEGSRHALLRLGVRENSENVAQTQQELEAHARGCLASLLDRKYQARRRQLEQEILAAESAGDSKRLEQLSTERLQLERSKHSITWMN